MIEKAGGKMLVSRLWEERRLAYQIKGHRKGTYWLTYFRLDGTKLTEVHRQCRLNDSIIRVLFTKIDPRIVDALVAHATRSPTEDAAADKGAKPAGAGTRAEKVADSEAVAKAEDAAVATADSQPPPPQSDEQKG